ncbi:MAG: AMP-binding protein [Thermodesulfobacteriota bacterium]|nr:AMP-binding protein [Thermodesulfobacteriota bacterium]
MNSKLKTRSLKLPESSTSKTGLTLPQFLLKHAEEFGGRAAIREKAYGIWQSYSWRDYLEFTKKVGLGLSALGLRRGDNIGIIMDNHPEWLFSQLGGQSFGAVALNLFTSAISEEVASTLNRIKAAYVIVEDQEQTDKLLEMRDRLYHVKKVIYVDRTGMNSYREDEWLMSFADLLEAGEELDKVQPELFAREVQKGRPDDIALMIMTSGTTGISKLAMMSHINFTEMAASWIETIPVGVEVNWLSISPPAWIVDQMWGTGVALTGGMTMNFPETRETLLEDFRELGPNILVTSSRFWEDLASTIRVKMGDAGFIRRKLFHLAESASGRITDLESQGKSPNPGIRLACWLAGVIIFRPLLDRIGCARFYSAYTGGHPISPDVIRFFRSLGLNLKQCYGLTESGGIFQVQPDNEVKAETVGKSLSGMNVKISEDQEVFLSSKTVFRGYYNDFQATETAFEDGWLRTGDAGYLDDDGHLVIIGRREEIIRNKQGEAFSPDFIETRLKFSPYIREAVTFGEGRPYITALINIDMGNVGNWAEERMIPYTTYTDLSQQSEVEKLVHAEIGKVNEKLPDAMKVRKCILLYKLLDADDEELTRTGKVRRRFVYGLYLKLIKAMYEDKKDLDVKATIRYRDGQVGTLKTRVRILEL